MNMGTPPAPRFSSMFIVELEEPAIAMNLVGLAELIIVVETPYACIATPLDSNFSIIGGVARSQTKRCISTTKRAIGLRLERGLAVFLEG